MGSVFDKGDFTTRQKKKIADEWDAGFSHGYSAATSRYISLNQGKESKPNDSEGD